MHAFAIQFDIFLFILLELSAALLVSLTPNVNVDFVHSYKSYATNIDKI